MQKPFEGVENLEAAYDLETRDNIKLYAAWADTYDTGYRASMNFASPSWRNLLAVGGGPKVLDIGAGTGISRSDGSPWPYGMDATDISQQVLDIRTKGLYTLLLVGCDRYLAR